MTDIIKSIILGIVEGLTEFLPVSSTGHLILVNQFLSFQEDFTKLFDIVIQVGAILAVVIYFWKDIIPKNFNILKSPEHLDLWKKVLVAVIPALVIGALAADFIEAKLFNPQTVAISLFIGGVILIFIERRKHNFKYEKVQELPYRVALYIGLFQCLAMIPGTSRSASTIIGALLLGSSRKLAAEFSFYLAIPTLVAASGYSLLKSHLAFSAHDMIILITGFLVSFGVAWMVIAFFMNFIRKHTFEVFGYYRIILSVLVVLYFFIFM